MSKELTTPEAAKKAGVSERRLRQLCDQGRVKNARKVGPVWIFDGAPVVVEAGRVRPSVIKMRKQPNTSTTKGKK